MSSISQLLSMLTRKAEADSGCLDRLSHAVADCVAGPWTSVPWWLLPVFYVLGAVSYGSCKRRLRLGLARAKLSLGKEPKSGRPGQGHGPTSGKPIIEARKKAELAASALDFGDKRSAMTYLAEAMALVDR